MTAAIALWLSVALAAEGVGEGPKAPVAQKEAAEALNHLVVYQHDPKRFQEELDALLARGGRSILAGNWPPLIEAAARGNEMAIRALLAAGADPNGRSEYGNTPLGEIAEHCGKCVDGARALIAAGAKIEAKEGSGSTPYEVAVRAGHAPTLGDLLAHLDWKPLPPGTSASASAVLVEPRRAADRYVPARAVDGAISTCWCMRGAKLPTFEEFDGPDGWSSPSPPWIELRFPRPVIVKALRIHPGCGKVPDVYEANNRISVLRSVIGENGNDYAYLPDEARFQDLGVRSQGPVDRVRLQVEAVYRGAKYDDTCIAEIQAVLE